MISKAELKDLERALCNKPSEFKKALLITYCIFFSALLYYFLS